MFFAANLTKLVHGAWLPLLIGVVAFTVMTTWQKGREIVTRAREKAEGPLREFVDGLRDCKPPLVRMSGHGGVPQPRQGDRTPGDARQRRAQPRAARARDHHVDRDRAGARGCPTTSGSTIDDLGYKRDGIIHVSACYGYMERPNIPAALRLLDPAQTEGHIDVDAASYFLSKLELIAGDEPTMAPWRKRLFIATSYITADAAAYFSLPLDRTVIIGSRIEV